MKFFAEKSGNRMLKGTICIKQGKFSMLEQIDVGHSFAFEIRMDDLIGTSEEAVQTLSVDNQQQLDQWREWIELSTQTEKRKGSLIMLDTGKAVESPSGAVPRSKSFLSNLFPVVEGGDASNSQQQGVTPTPTPKPKEDVAASEEDTVSDTLLPLPSLHKPAKPLTRRPSKAWMQEKLKADAAVAEKAEEEAAVTAAITPTATEESSELDMDKLYTEQDSSEFAANVSATGSNSGNRVNGDSEDETATTAEANSLAAKLEMKLNARRQSFKPPNFKNLLNSNGFEHQSRRSMAQGGSGVVSETNSETDTMPPSVNSTHGQNTPRGDGLGSSQHRRTESQETARALLNHSPLSEPIRIETPTLELNPSAAAVARGEGLAPRRSFTKSPARRRNSKKSSISGQHGSHGHGHGIAANDSDTSRSVTPSPVPAGATTTTHPLTRHLKISVRPTEPQRMGYLLRLDTAHAHDASGLGQDSWLNQYITLDITTGIMKIFSEVNEKRIQRLKFDINSCTVKSIDQLFHSRLHCFKISFRPEDPAEKKISAVFAAESEDALNYWLISFEDCEVYYHTHGAHLIVNQAEKKPEPQETADAAAGLVKEVAKASQTFEPASLAATVQPATQSVEPGKVDPSALMAALKKRTAAKAEAAAVAAQATTVATTAAAVEEDEPDDEEPSHTASMLPFTKTLHSRFASAPAVAQAPIPMNMPMPPFGVAASTGSGGEGAPRHAALGDYSPYGSSEALVGDGGTLLRVNTMNMDQMFSSSTPKALVTAPAAPASAPAAVASTSSTGVFFPPESSNSSLISAQIAPIASAYDFSKVNLSLQRVRYPSERLARRIKIWYLSGGFCISTAAEVEEFVRELRKSGDKVLRDFSEEKFGDLQDWANLLTVLRKYEQRKTLEAPPRSALERTPTNGISFDIASSITGDSSSSKEFALHVEKSTIAPDLSREIAAQIGVPMKDVEGALPQLLLGRDNNIISKGLGQLCEEFTLAEDILLYQEEVINNIWMNFEKQKAVLEERDETIDSLYERLTAAENAAPITSISHPGMNNAGWAEEKNQLLQAHNETKVRLITEIQTLRKVLTPTAEQQFEALRNSEYLRAGLEEEIVNAHIRNDNLKAELAMVKDKLEEAENEKAAIEAHWQEQIMKIKAEHDRAIAALQEDVNKTKQTAQKAAEEAANARRLASRPSSAPTVPLVTPNSYIDTFAMNASTSASSASTLVPPTPTTEPSSTTPPTASETAAASVMSSPVKSLTITSRYASPPKRQGEEVNQQRQNKTYTNPYASFEDPSEKEAGNRTKANKPPNQYNPYSYSMELKEDAPVTSGSQRSSPWMSMDPATGGVRHHSSESMSGNVSVSSYRRDELIDPEDEIDDSHPSPPRKQQSTQIGTATSSGASAGTGASGGQPPSGATNGNSGQWNKTRNVMQASLRMMRLPNSGTASPMPPGSFPNTPAGAAGALLQIPRSQMKNNPIRAQLKSEGQLARQPSLTAKMPGAYMAPHSVKYQVMSAETEEGQRSKGVPPPSPTSAPQQGFMSATKATTRQHQLIRESARDTFAKTYTYQKKQ
eukprot:CAMPEP_0170449154 /NCGR_PEP_ID=MMETSP0117_2-20130122/51095_1 /TAXON_ID=400756 /ORGANISM="Durinskia baltica, Strain CSIRO CS-38" /LENGTH=1562 /DNA_ID=CAMNT_0010710381 /DNA_START=163 /DNA_END=4851 /DNA_ORIENTATION=+